MHPNSLPQSIAAADPESIDRLQSIMSRLPQASLRTQHYFADGMYCRELFRGAGTLIVGKVHKKEHFYIVLFGELTVLVDGKRERIVGPKIIVSRPGTKRAVYAHTDALCITVHRVSSHNLDDIEREVIEPDESALFDARNELKLLDEIAS